MSLTISRLKEDLAAKEVEKDKLQVSLGKVYLFIIIHFRCILFTFLFKAIGNIINKTIGNYIKYGVEISF